MESAVSTATATPATKPLHPNLVKTALAVAIILPLVLLATLVLLMISANYNFLSWME